MIVDKRERFNWQFVLLSSDLGGLDDAVGTGVYARKSMRFSKTAAGTTAMFFSVSKKISDYRSYREKEVSFDGKDRKKQGG